MPSKRAPIHRQLSSPESKKKPRVKQTKKTVSRGNAAANQKMLKGVITALRSDNTVNLTIQGNRFLGVPVASFGGVEINALNAGDKVWVHRSGGNYLVFGKQNSDDLENAPTIFPVTFAQWSWGVDQGNNDKTLYGVGPGLQVGRKSELFPTDDADYLARLGISYWDGTNNLMNGPADLVKQIDFYVERDEWDDGFQGPAYFTLFGIKNDALPTDPGAASLQYQTTLTPASIDFTLEPGEMKIITLPDTWRNNIGGTVGAATIRGFVIEPQSTNMVPWSLQPHTFGAFTAALSGGLRIF